MKTALVTGASRGIGAAIAKKLAHLGYRVFINYNKSKKEAMALCEEINTSGGTAYIICADVSKTSEIDRMFSEIKKICSGIDLLINNAGVAKIGLFDELSEEEYDNIFNTNMKSAYFCSKLAVSHMIGNQNGKIINISSMWGITGSSCEVAYSASKAALIGFTKALAKELAPSGICVNCIAPGVIDTDMNKIFSEDDMMEIKKEIPLGEIGTPDSIADIVEFLASPASSYITGQVINASGGMVI